MKIIEGIPTVTWPWLEYQLDADCSCLTSDLNQTLPSKLLLLFVQLMILKELLGKNCLLQKQLWNCVFSCLKSCTSICHLDHFLKFLAWLLLSLKLFYLRLAVNYPSMDKHILRSMKRLFLHKNWEILSSKSAESYNNCSNASTVHQFIQVHYTFAGYDNIEDYYAAHNPIDWIPKVRLKYK